MEQRHIAGIAYKPTFDTTYFTNGHRVQVTAYTKHRTLKKWTRPAEIVYVDPKYILVTFTDATGITTDIPIDAVVAGKIDIELLPDREVQ